MDRDPRLGMIELIQKHKQLIVCEGIAFVILGIIALCMPVFFSLALGFILGLLCIFAACTLAFRIAQGKELPHTSSSIMSMILYLVLGLVLVAYPVSGVITLNLLLACFFVFDGTFKIISAIQMRPAPQWGWIFCSGFLSFLLSLLILLAVPEGSAWVLGIFLGINLLFTGLVQLYLAWSVSKI